MAVAVVLPVICPLTAAGAAAEGRTAAGCVVGPEGLPAAGELGVPELGFYSGQNIPITAATSAWDMTACDFEGDGRHDVAVTGRYDDYVYTFTRDDDGDGRLHQTASYAVSSPTGIISADLTGDGYEDLAVASFNTGKIYVFRSLAALDGGFYDPVESDAGVTNPYALIASDFDPSAEGLELAVVGYTTSTTTPGKVALLSNQGHGSFTPVTEATLTVGYQPTSVAAGDFNRDNVPDLVVGHRYVPAGSAELLVFQGRGGLSFDLPVAFGASRSSNVYAVDVTDDGCLDIVDVCGSDNKLAVYPGNKDGRIGSAYEFDVTGGPSDVAFCDPDGDGKVDLVSVNIYQNTVAILRNTSTDGLVPAFSTPEYYMAGIDPAAVLVNDYDSDGGLDALVLNKGLWTADHPLAEGPILSLYPMDNTGVLDGPRPIAAGAQPEAVAVADFDGLYGPDLAVSNRGANTVTIYLADGEGGYTSTTYESDYGTGPADLVVGDFDGRNGPDLAVANRGNNTVYILCNDGSGGLEQTAGIKTLLLHALAVADFDQDGHDDVACGRASEGLWVDVYYGLGDGSFPEAPSQVLGNSDDLAGITYVLAADFNNDGYPDLAVSGASRVYVSFYDPAPASGSPGFGPLVGVSEATYPGALAAGDFNGDGRLDIVAADRDPSVDPLGSFVHIIWGNGGGVFDGGASSIELADVASSIGLVGYPTRSLEAADFNGDGFLDLAALMPEAETVAVLLGNGNGTFGDDPGDPYASSYRLPTGPVSLSLTAADVNGDLKADLTFVSRFDWSVWSYANTTTIPGVFRLLPTNGEEVTDGVLVSEGVGNAAFEVIRTAGADGEVTVHFGTNYLGAYVDHPAEGGLDYSVVDEHLVFGEGEISKPIEVPITADAVWEYSETFSVGINAAPGAVNGNPYWLYVVVRDDDACPVGFAPEHLEVTEGGSATYVVSVSERPSESIIITASVADPGVTVCSDVLGAAPGPQASFTFTPDDWDAGLRTHTVTVRAVEDKTVEKHEAVLISHAAAVGEAGTGGPLPDVAVDVVDNDAYASPRSLKAVPLQTTETAGVTLSWLPPAVPVGGTAPAAYAIYVGNGPKTIGTLAAVVLAEDLTLGPKGVFVYDVTQESLDDAGVSYYLTPNMRHYFTVRAAFDETLAGASKPSNVANSLAGPVAPPAPVSLKARTAPDGVYLCWSPPKGPAPSHYEVQVSASSKMDPILWSGEVEDRAWAGSLPNFQVTSNMVPGGLLPEAKYYFSVTSYATHPYTGDEVKGKTARANAVAGPIPGPPGAPTGAKGTTVGNAILLTWKPPSSGLLPSHYRLKVLTNPALPNDPASYVDLATVPLDPGQCDMFAPSYTVTAAELRDAGASAGDDDFYVPGQKYTILIYSMEHHGVGWMGSEKAAKVTATAGPVAVTPSGLKVTKHPSGLKLTWKGSPAVTNYRVDISVDPTFTDYGGTEFPWNPSPGDPEFVLEEWFAADIAGELYRPGTVFYFRVYSIARNPLTFQVTYSAKFASAKALWPVLPPPGAEE